eukprot:CAMPEP_0117650612 /NCGR_PEP_ID=MMETSP0804-20121206/1633_1 /TAXON_ID=1074897 /ORGANISM="Tetraselmis astigmatica, Strain CCMP880" /LENGTH=115 /DNA_ID=CAMNT_0005456497 /DNA_START=1531 /DNA_END=1878 /DNA_ORIENTATION=-
MEKVMPALQSHSLSLVASQAPSWAAVVVARAGIMKSRPAGHQTEKNFFTAASSPASIIFIRVLVSTAEPKANAPAVMPAVPAARIGTAEGTSDDIFLIVPGNTIAKCENLRENDK